MSTETQKVDVLAVIDRAISSRPAIDIQRAKEGRNTFARDLIEARAAVAELIEGRYSQKVRLGCLLDALRFDEQLHGNNPNRSTLDFPHAIQIVEAAIAALARVGGES